MVAVAAIAVIRVIGMFRDRVTGARPGREGPDLGGADAGLRGLAGPWLKAATGSVPLLADGGRNAAGAPFIALLKAIRHNFGPHPPAPVRASTTCGSWNWPSLSVFSRSRRCSGPARATSAPGARAAGVHPLSGGDLRRHAEHLEQPGRRHALVSSRLYLLAVIILLGTPPAKPSGPWLLPEMARADRAPPLVAITQRQADRFVDGPALCPVIIARRRPLTRPPSFYRYGIPRRSVD